MGYNHGSALVVGMPLLDGARVMQGPKHGRSAHTNSNQVNHSVLPLRAGVVMGLLALAEPLPPTRSMRLLLLASWAAVALGVSSMSGSSSSSSRDGVLGLLQLRLSALPKALLLLLPRGLRRRLPRRVLHWLGRGANIPGGLGFGVYLRQVMFGGRTGGNSGDGLSLRFYDEAAVAEVLEGLGFGDGQQQQQHQEGSPAGGRVLRSTSLGLSDDGGPGLPVAAAAAAAVGGGGGGGPGNVQQQSVADFGGVLGPMGGRRM